MSYKFYCFFLISCFLWINAALGQEVNAKEGSYGVDEKHKIIVWHNTNIDSILLKNRKVKSFVFDRHYDVAQKLKAISHSETLLLNYENESYTLYVTKLPVVHLNIDHPVEDDVKKAGYFTYYNENRLVKSIVGIEHRGNLSLSFPKKSYDLEFWSDSLTRKSKDIKLMGLRSDDDWILDGLFNEPLRLRSTIAAKLWLSIYRPSYLESESEAKSGFDCDYVEVFKDGEYLGIYALSESVDRKQLALKKNEGKTINGELFKAFSYEGAPAFKKAPEYDNVFPHWAGFEMKYPLVDSRSHWDDIFKLIDLVVNQKDDAVFEEKIGLYVDVDNVIDYFLFANLLRATDNLGKNYYLARYDTDTPYFIVPWDLDGTFGIIQEGKRISTTNDVLSNGLFDRLLKVNPNGYREKLKQRWGSLRKSEFADSELLGSLEKHYIRMKSEKIYERERAVWPENNSLEDDFNYLNSWLSDRLAYLDGYFDQL